MVEEDGGRGSAPDSSFKTDLDHDGRWSNLLGEGELTDDPARIREIAATDAARLPTMRDHRDGWEKMATLGADIKAFLADRISARLTGNIANAVSTVGDQAAKTRDSAELFGAAADLNKQGVAEIITQVTTFDDTVNGLEKERGLLPGSKPGESKLSDDTEINNGLDAELREALLTANLGYNGAYTRYAYKPPTYDGAPEWTGPAPQTPPGWSGDTPGRDGGAPISPDLGDRPDVIVDDGPGFGDDPDVIVDDGPTLQNPSTPTTPAPNPVTPSPGPAPTPPIGGLPIGPGMPPGSGARPLPPPVGPRPTPAPPAARPTPGMGTPPSRSLSGSPARTTASGRGGVGAPAGRGAPTGTKASRALLPNQRPGGTGANPARGAVPRPGAVTGRTASGTGQFGGRARTTVPTVIGARGTAKPTGTATPPVRNAGKVFGERANKGRAAAKSALKELGGILDRQGFSEKLTSERSWSNAPQKRRIGATFQGKVIGNRGQKPEDARAAAAELAKRRREEKVSEAALAEWRANRNALPDHQIVEGLNFMVVPDVIEQTKQGPEHIQRSSIGPVFGPKGWENNSEGQK